jgi:hypothetical protein
VRVSLPFTRPGRREDQAEGVIAFVHIPKTAGGTVTSLFAAAYSVRGIGKTGNYVRSAEKTERKLIKKTGADWWARWREAGGRVTIGHTPYGALRDHLPPDTRYMTFLRDPVDRVLSHYWRHIHRRDPRRAGRGKERAGNIPKSDSLEEAMVEMRLPQLNNLATRFLCGAPSPMDELPASALEDAKGNLRGFAFLGIQERFAESIVLLQRTLGLGLVPRESYQNRHVSRTRPSVDEIPDEQRALIEDYNRLDVELYSFGAELFESAVAAAGKGFATEVDALRTTDLLERLRTPIADSI